MGCHPFTLKECSARWMPRFVAVTAATGVQQMGALSGPSDLPRKMAHPHGFSGVESERRSLF
jgi:hypothetical protein